MKSTNKIGFLAVFITVILLLAIYGIWRGVSAFLQSRATKAQQVAISMQKKSADVPSTLTDEQAQELKTKIVQELKKNGTFTSQYLATLPANLPKDQVLDKTKVEAFINENKGEFLPVITNDQIKISQNKGKEAVKTYLDSISSDNNKNIKAITNQDIETAYKAYYADPKQSTALKDIKNSLTQNLAALKNIEVPAEALPIHKKILSATTALLKNIYLLETMPTDFVGGLIGAKNIEDLGPVFTSITEDIATLQKTYGL